MRSIIDPPPRSALARFGPAFGQRFLLVLDTGTMPQFARFEAFFESEGVTPVVADGEDRIDTSVQPKFDHRAVGGADYRRHPLVPYWLDDEQTRLELPRTAVFWGMLRRQGDWLYPAFARTPRRRRLLANLGLLDRVRLNPNGVSVDHAIRGIDMALDDGLPVLVFSFDLSSVNQEEHFVGLCDWWSRVFAYLELRNVKPTTAAEIMSAVRR
jgi:hypothetical protein